jgi:peptidoglycan/LPS O-acetylase OafA/YrhL
MDDRWRLVLTALLTPVAAYVLFELIARPLARLLTNAWSRRRPKKTDVRR